MKNARRPPPSVPLWGRVGAWVKKTAPEPRMPYRSPDDCRGREHYARTVQGGMDAPGSRSSPPRFFRAPFSVPAKERKGMANLRGEKTISGKTGERIQMGRMRSRNDCRQGPGQFRFCAAI